MNTNARIKEESRARITLLLDMALFAWLIGLAIIGGIMNSGIHRMLEGIGQAHSLILVIAAVGAWGLGLALVEWFWGKSWPDDTVRCFYRARFWAAGFAILTWIVLASTIYLDADVSNAQFPLVFGPVCCLFHFISGGLTLRSAILIDPAKDTRVYEARRERDPFAAQ